MHNLHKCEDCKHWNYIVNNSGKCLFDDFIHEGDLLNDCINFEGVE